MANMEHAKNNEEKLENILWKIKRSKILCETSTISQEKQAFPKTVNEAVKTDITPPVEIKAENNSLLNKVLINLLMQSLHKEFEENQHTSRSAHSQWNWNCKHCMNKVLTKKALHWSVIGWDGFDQINSQKPTKPQDRNWRIN